MGGRGVSRRPERLERRPPQTFHYDAFGPSEIRSELMLLKRALLALSPERAERLKHAPWNREEVAALRRGSRQEE